MHLRHQQGQPLPGGPKSGPAHPVDSAQGRPWPLLDRIKSPMSPPAQKPDDDAPATGRASRQPPASASTHVLKEAAYAGPDEMRVHFEPANAPLQSPDT